MKKNLLILFIALSLKGLCQDTLYVDGSQSSGGNGKSWTTAISRRPLMRNKNLRLADHIGLIIGVVIVLVTLSVIGKCK